MTAGVRSSTIKLDQAPDLVSLIPAHSGLAWLTEATSLVAEGPFLAIDPGVGPDRFERGAEAVADFMRTAQIDDEVDVPGSGPVVFGSWTFDEDAPGSRLLIPATIYGCGDAIAWKTSVDIHPDPAEQPARPGARPYRTAPDETTWVHAVERVLAAIAAGEVEKVVLARSVSVTTADPVHQQDLARRLVQEYPGCFTFCFDDLVGASPELLVRRVGELVDSVPLAGSTRRGATEQEDNELGRHLKESSKNLMEHALAVATVMDKLDPWCFELLKEPEPSLLLLANLQHLSTKVQGRLKGAPSALDLAGALHPTAAVCGVPQEGAMIMIRKLEGFDRGRYAGPVGWMDHRGDGEWALALRCAQINGNQAEIYAGAGIVAKSSPAAELDETTLKLKAVLSALGPLAG